MQQLTTTNRTSTHNVLLAERLTKSLALASDSGAYLFF